MIYPTPAASTAWHSASRLSAGAAISAGRRQTVEITLPSGVQNTPTNTHLFLAELRQTCCEVVHVRGVREDARHALPQQLVPVYQCSSGCVLPLAALLCHPEPPSLQHLQQIHNANQSIKIFANIFTLIFSHCITLKPQTLIYVITLLCVRANRAAYNCEAEADEYTPPVLKQLNQFNFPLQTFGFDIKSMRTEINIPSFISRYFTSGSAYKSKKMAFYHYYYPHYSIDRYATVFNLSLFWNL